MFGNPNLEPCTLHLEPFLCLIAPAGFKKFLHQSPAFRLKHPSNHFKTVVQTPVLRNFIQRPQSPGLGVSRPVDDLVQPDLDHGPGTHQTGFDGDQQGGSRKPIIIKKPSGLSQNQDLGMGRRIIVAAGFGYDRRQLFHPRKKPKRPRWGLPLRHRPFRPPSRPGPSILPR